MNFKRLRLFSALVLLGVLVIAAQGWGAELTKSDLQRSSSEGPVSIDLVYLTPLEEKVNGALTFEVRMNTHSVALDQYDLGHLSRLETSEGQKIAPLGWFNPGGGGHHRYGQVRFPATGPDGSPLVGPETRFIEVVIEGVGGVAERRFRWELPLTK